MKIFVVFVFALLIFSIAMAILVYDFKKIDKGEEIMEENKQESNVYQGPVPEGYDLDHFRKTGETIKIK